MKVYALLFSLYALAQMPAYGQLLIDSSTVRQDMSAPLSRYINSLGINASIYSGKENADPRFPINAGHPFWDSPDPVEGDILFDGIVYRKIPLWYDISKNEVVVQHPTRNARIAVDNNLVSYFQLGNALFVPADRSLESSELLEDNFYRVLADGELTLLARYTKKMSEVIQEAQYVTNYSRMTSQYFVLKDKRYYKVHSIKDALNLMGDKRHTVQESLNDVQQQLRRDKIKESAEQLMARAVGLFNRIGL